MVNVWNPKRALELGDDEPIALKGHAGNVLYVAFSPSGKVLASSGTAGKQIRLWDLSTLPRPVHFEGCDVPWYSRGEALRSWTQDGLPQLCANSNRSLDRPEQREGTSCMVRSQDGRLLATGHEDGTVELQMLDSGKTRRLRERHDGPVVNLLFSPNAKSMVSVEPAHPLRNVLKLWDVAAGNVLRTLNVSRWADPVFSEDLEVWAMVNEDPVTGVHSIKLWRADTGEELKTITEGQAYPYFSLEFSAHGQMLAAGDVWGEITVWDVNSGKHHLKPFQAHTSNVVGLAFSPDGTRLASGSYDRTVKLWDMATGDEMLTLRGHRRGLLSVGFSPDGSSLATASADGVVKLWRAATE